MSGLPKDPVILLSYINTQLRDNYSSLGELCAALDVREEELRDQLAVLNCEYDPERNVFS